MIIFINDGRLGNQIFHFAFLRRIARRKELMLLINMEMYFQAFDFEKSGIWHSGNHYLFLLARFFFLPFLKSLARARIISSVGIKKNAEQDADSLDFVERRGLFSFLRFVETDFYQSEKYFLPDFVCSIKMKAQYLREADIFLRSISDDFKKVFVHVRRGDYINEVFMNERGIDLPKAYFKKAIELIKQEVQNPFFIFLTDDPSYCSDCFEELENKTISMNSMFVDFAIMMLCDAGIISNSSFSWWGAYLMKSKGRLIAPRYWYGWKQKVEFPACIQASCFKTIEF